jgi:hypothetical protein
MVICIVKRAIDAPGIFGFPKATIPVSKTGEVGGFLKKCSVWVSQPLAVENS